MLVNIEELLVKVNVTNLYCSFSAEVPRSYYVDYPYRFRTCEKAEVTLNKVTTEGIDENILYLLQDFVTAKIEKEIAVYIGDYYEVDSIFYTDYK
jgi:hypothetical protein